MKKKVKWYNKGHAKVSIGGLLDGRYKILKQKGKGAFSKVLECYDEQLKTKVAIKILRLDQNKYAREEIEILRDVRVKQATSSHDAKCIRLLRTFRYKGHYCMVFPVYPMCLKTFLDKHEERGGGLDMRHIKKIAFDLLTAIYFLHSNNIVHTDIKLENILLKNIEFADITLIDFGSATFENDPHEDVITTSHYRAPEVILGIPWSYPVDLWSVGCILFEILCGDLMYNPKNNAEHLGTIEHYLGPIPPHMALNSKYKDSFFDQTGQLMWPKIATKKSHVKYVQSLDDIQTEILLAEEYNGATKEESGLFFDLLLRLLTIDPTQRITASQALQHSFLRGERENDAARRREVLRHKLKASQLAPSRISTQTDTPPTRSTMELHLKSPTSSLTQPCRRSSAPIALVDTAIEQRMLDEEALEESKKPNSSTLTDESSEADQEDIKINRDGTVELAWESDEETMTSDGASFDSYESHHDPSSSNSPNGTKTNSKKQPNPLVRPATAMNPNPRHRIISRPLSSISGPIERTSMTTMFKDVPSPVAQRKKKPLKKTTESSSSQDSSIDGQNSTILQESNKPLERKKKQLNKHRKPNHRTPALTSVNKHLRSKKKKKIVTRRNVVGATITSVGTHLKKPSSPSHAFLSSSSRNLITSPNQKSKVSSIRTPGSPKVTNRSITSSGSPTTTKSSHFPKSPVTNRIITSSSSPTTKKFTSTLGKSSFTKPASPLNRSKVSTATKSSTSPISANAMRRGSGLTTKRPSSPTMLKKPTSALSGSRGKIVNPTKFSSSTASRGTIIRSPYGGRNSPTTMRSSSSTAPFRISRPPKSVLLRKKTKSDK